MSSRLIIDGLAKSFPGRPVFSGISVEIERGSRLMITGPNGSGKSTLVRILCAFIRPTSGTVTLHLDDQQLKWLEMRRHSGLVSPDLVLYDELTAIENLTFFAQVAGFHAPPPLARRKLGDVGLVGRENDLVGSYSSGMKQRLKYCLALLRNPELLLLDEPSANLDENGKQLVDKIIKSHEGIVVIATNEKSELEYGDQVIRLG